jgi:hypothetical protein
VDTFSVEEGFERRLYFSDARGNDRYLRVTWHADTSTIVLSHWRDDICVATTGVSLQDATRLIGLIVGALKESASVPVIVPTPERAVTKLLTRFRRRWRPQLAEIVRLSDRIRPARTPGQGRNA